MDEMSLSLAGVGPCRANFVKRVLRKKCFDIVQVSIVFAYAIFVIACFIMHDLQYEERCKAFLINRQEMMTDSSEVALT